MEPTAHDPTLSLDPLVLERRHAPGVYPVRDRVLVRGEGAVLFDSDGRRYIDCAAGQGVAALGHGHPRLAAAIAAQAGELITCSGSWPTQPRARLAGRLSAAVPIPTDQARLFWCNSGTEAIEAALKFARLGTGRAGVVALERGFHGRTFGALSATFNPAYKAPFEPLVPGFAHVPPNDIAALDAAVGADTAAVLLEVVQGEGGVHPLDADYLRSAQALCAERGALLIVDEIQTGFGRTGRMFASEHAGLEPDLIALGKAIGGGLPMGAVAIGPRVGELPPGSHGSTFGGNPLACAAALCVLDVFRDEGLVARAAETGAWLAERLRGLAAPRAKGVRGLGLMLAVDVGESSKPYLARLVEEGVIALPAGPEGIRLLPPLVIERDELEEVLAALERVLA